MKNCYLILFLFSSIVCFSQQKQFNINWAGTKLLQTDYGKIEVPSFDTEHFSYNERDGLTFFDQWDSNGVDIDESYVTLSNINYETINASDLKNLSADLIPDSPQYSLRNVNARGKHSYYLELSPIIKDKGVYKKITTFSIKYRMLSGRSTNSKMGVNEVTNSVLSTGQWYRFYIDKSGVFQLTKNFLGSIGVNTNSVDPRTIKIYGNGGRMLPYSNAANYPLDVVENAVKFVGEEDGSFDNNDYILFHFQI